jgi:hypothetical protein
MSNIMQSTKPSLYQPSNNAILRNQKSLNRERRRKELVKITIENQAFLRRLQGVQATCSVETWENEFSQQVKHRNNLCENPYQFGDGLMRARG